MGERLTEATSIDDVLFAWDEVNAAASKVETSLPFQMSESIRELESTRKVMQRVLQNFYMGPAGRSLLKENPNG